MPINWILGYKPQQYQHLTPADEGSTHISHIQSCERIYTHIQSILKTLILSHISQKQSLYKI